MLNFQNFIDTMQADLNKVNQLALYIVNLRRESLKFRIFIIMDICWFCISLLTVTPNLILYILGLGALSIYIHKYEVKIILKNEKELPKLVELLKEQVKEYERKYSVKIL